MYFQITSPVSQNSGWIKTNTWSPTGLATNTGYTFTVTATITNSSGGNLLYKEIGLAVTVTHSASPYYFLLCHDQVNSGSGYTVSNSGTLSVTYTGTFT